MSTMDRRVNDGESLRLSATSAPSAVLVGLALALSWATMLAHNLYELPLAVGDLENTGPLVVALVLLVAYWRRGGSRVVQWPILGCAVGQMPLVLVAVAAISRPPHNQAPR